MTAVANVSLNKNKSGLGTKVSEYHFHSIHFIHKSSLNQKHIPACYISVSRRNVLLSHCIIALSSASSYTIPPLHQITFFTMLRALKIHCATRRQPENSFSRVPGAERRLPAPSATTRIQCFKATIDFSIYRF